IFNQVIPDDLIKYGLIPELVGRLPVHSSLHELDEEALVRILTEPRNAIIKQYKKLFQIEGVNLEFSREALLEIAHTAIKQKIGARGLRSIMEKFMIEIMYDLPDRQNVNQCLISKEVVLGKNDPVFTYEQRKKGQTA
ncbi:MAG: ATP-dependent Clp protease ATP-binding subunit ClpX, partial [Candidatus Cloacimonetes bacterium]|nr:ATP-dependent Clp protease ATP-binding subunit ClpX [Candidatus Cloacimonadota bacterium]